MFVIECLDSEYDIFNILNISDNLIFLDKEKIIIISDNYIEKIKQKIILLHFMLDNNIINETKPIIIPLKNINYNDMKFVINFFEIDNDIINNFFKDLNKNDQYVSSINTRNMPKILIEFFNDYTVYNTIDISELKDIELDYNKLKYLEKISQIADFLQYDLLCDASQYKYADNIRIINKTLLKSFMKEKLINLEEINKIYDYIHNNNNINFLDEITIIDYETLQKFKNNKLEKNIIIEEIINQILYDLDQLY